jgi:hypothetical protein
MRKWIVVAGLAAVLLVAALLVRGGTRPPAPEAAHPAPDGSHPAPDASHPASDAPPPMPEAAHPAPGAPHPGQTGDATDGAMHPEVLDENARALLAYPITMKRLETYVAAVKEIRAAGEKDAKLMARLREPGPAGEQPTGMAARLEAIAPLKTILDRHGLAGIDLVFMPQAVVAGRTAYAAEQEGHPVPPDRMNAASVALYRADLRRMDAITKTFMADLRVLSGR